MVKNRREMGMIVKRRWKVGRMMKIGRKMVKIVIRGIWKMGDNSEK